MQQSYGKAIRAGIVGLFVMTILSYLGSLMISGMTRPWAMLAVAMGSRVLGWAGHIIIGLILALIYAYVLAEVLPGNPWVKGAIYGILPWLAAMIIVIPMMGMPLFAGSFMVALGSLIGHVLYGAFVGGVYGQPTTAAAQRAKA